MYDDRTDQYSIGTFDRRGRLRDTISCESLKPIDVRVTIDNRYLLVLVLDDWNHRSVMPVRMFRIDWKTHRMEACAGWNRWREKQTKSFENISTRDTWMRTTHDGRILVMEYSESSMHTRQSRIVILSMHADEWIDHIDLPTSWKLNRPISCMFCECLHDGIFVAITDTEDRSTGVWIVGRKNQSNKEILSFPTGDFSIVAIESDHDGRLYVATRFEWTCFDGDTWQKRFSIPTNAHTIERLDDGMFMHGIGDETSTFDNCIRSVYISE